MNKIYFLSGLPRSGSTLLTNILAQNPVLSVTPTSGLIDLLGAILVTADSNPTLTDWPKERLLSILKAVIATEYNDGNICYIDKSRGWIRPGVIETMEEVLGYRPKIIATVRPIPDCVTSLITISNALNVEEFVKQSPLMDHLKYSYDAIKAGFAKYPESIHFVEYDNLVSAPQEEIAKIYKFLELPDFNHDFNNIENIVKEDDEARWGIKDLHTVRPTIQKVSKPAIEVLGPTLFEFLDVVECWNPNKPIKPQVRLLDLALENALKGNAVVSESLIDAALSINPNDNRAKFNKGWYELSRGNLLLGIKLLSCGRNENIFGNPPPSSQPMWQGEDLTNKTVLLNLEGGLGDHICNARFATNFANLGAKVILAGNPGLVAKLLYIPGVIAYIRGDSAGAAYHDYWVPAASAPALLGLEYNNLSGKPYLPCKYKEKSSSTLRVGIRWSGNPNFEHEQYRRFDHEPLFNLKNVQLVNLQRDTDDVIPSYVEQPDLSNWELTCQVLESLDLVITSCTSIAHMAAAMGKPTWVIVPLVPYYIWAMPGDTSPWYETVKLFRQVEPGNWDKPFEELTKALNDFIM